MDIYTVDAFTGKPYSGNPAGVCVLKNRISAQSMQNIAAEINMSETAFLLEAADGYMLRWFSPLTEVDLCGHGTLASAHLLWERGIAEGDEIKFHTKSGLLTARRKGRLIELDFPLELDEQTEAPSLLRESLGVPFKYVGKNRMDYIVEVEDQKVVETLQPDFALMNMLSSRGVIVTAAADDADTDFVSRCFFPALGIDEDPVTGSAHCCMGPYWAQKLGKRELSAKQLSKRGGELKLTVLDERILIYGQAVTVLKGELVAEG